MDVGEHGVVLVKRRQGPPRHSLQVYAYLREVYMIEKVHWAKGIALVGMSPYASLSQCHNRNLVDPALVL